MTSKSKSATSAEQASLMFERRHAVCKRLQISSDTLSRLIKAGFLPAGRVLVPGSRIRIWPSTVIDDFILNGAGVAK